MADVVAMEVEHKIEQDIPNRTHEEEDEKIKDDNNVNEDEKNNENDDDDDDRYASCNIPKPPSHILADGTYVYLPEPTDLEKARAFEREVALSRLISATERSLRKDDDDDADADASANDNDNDGNNEGNQQEEIPKRRNGNSSNSNSNSNSNKKKKTTEEAKIHPLAIASARIHAGGLNELSRAINLCELVQGNEYLGLSNVVVRDEAAAVTVTTTSTTTTSTTAEADAKGDGVTGVASGTGAADGPTASSKEDEEGEAPDHQDRLRSSYLLRRKRMASDAAADSLDVLRRRLGRCLRHQRLVDSRLLDLRKRWRLTAPEHGTVAVGHAVFPNERVAVDVEVYRGDSYANLARTIPRYATLEAAADGMTTIAEPYAVADPTLGKVDREFDPNKVPLLTMWLCVERSATGEVEESILKERATTNTTSTSTKTSTRPAVDERVLTALQHSLFCASLFECLREEIHRHHYQSNDNSDLDDKLKKTKSDATTKGALTNNAMTTDDTQSRPDQDAVWLSSCEMERNFLPNNLTANKGLCILHCHESEIKVRLDADHALTVRLIEADSSGAVKNDNRRTNNDDNNNNNNNTDTFNKNTETNTKGTDERLRLLCRTLLLQAQFLYHEHALRMAVADSTTTTKQHNKTTASSSGVDAQGSYRGQPTIVSSTPKSSRILEQCVALGSKILLERKIRSTLKKFSKWVRTRNIDGVTTEGDDRRPHLSVEWLPLSFFDCHAYFVLTVAAVVALGTNGGADVVRQLTVDVTLRGPDLTVTQIGDDGVFQKVTFSGSTEEFEAYLKYQVSRKLFPPTTRPS